MTCRSTTRAPAASALVFPLALAGLRAVGADDAPLPRLVGVVHVADMVHPAGAVLVVALVAQGVAALATVHNEVTPPLLPQAERERGVRVCAIAGFSVAAALGLASVWL